MKGAALSRRMRRPLALRTLALALGVGAVLASVPIAGASAADPITCPTPAASASATPDGIGLTAVVCGPAAAPGSGSAPGNSGTAVPGGGTRGGVSSGGAGAPASGVADGAGTPVVRIGEIDLGGILAVSGLTASASPAWNPLGGTVEVSLTVRNMSKSTIEATADFWMENPIGLRIATVDGVALKGLKPGESRTVGADLAGAGQWIVLTAHGRVNPPAEVDGTELTPLTRDATVFLAPWLLMLLSALGVTAAAVVTIVRSARDAATLPVGATA